jgi:hypothetical protein
MSSFKTEYKERCTKIIDELFQHPIAEVFRRPVDPQADDVPEYFDIVKHPSDLGTVRTKLKNDRYRSLQDFKRDVNLIWENAELYNGKQSLPCFIGAELSRLFNRRFSALEEPPAEQWVNEYLKTRAVLCKLFRTAPKGLAITFASEFGPDQTETVPMRRRVPEADVEFFRNAKETIEKKAELNAQLLDIVRENESALAVPNSLFGLDLGLLSRRTLALLRERIEKEPVVQEPEAPQPIATDL